LPITVKILKRVLGGRPTLYATRSIDVLPISIGRDAACTIALEDPQKHMSRFHVEIAEEGGLYWLSVVSKVNPVMVKGTRHGPGARLALSSGDSFDLADYEVQVLLSEAQPAPAAVEPAMPRSSEGDQAERLFNEATFFGEEAPRPQKIFSAGVAAPAPEETFIPGKAPAHPLRAFFQGAGLPHKDLPPLETDRMLRDGGAILRAAVEGIMRLLVARAGLRKEFEAEGGTMVAARDNNPLRLMSDAREAMEFLFDPGDRTDGFLDPVQAVADACDDMRAHELALVAGMRAAVVGALRRLDPQVVERALEKTPKGFSLASRKAKLWDLFVAQQDKLAREAQDDFHKAFGREFIAAYHAHLRRLKGGR
jgi:predicted component of type VI protein secretion system